MNIQSINENIASLREVAMELYQTNPELSNIISDRCVDIEIELFGQDNQITLEQLEGIVMSSDQSDEFRLVGGMLYRNDEVIGGVAHIPVACICDLLNK